ncbi:hypothetical protein CXB51_026560 [Gossypium anomalum]|uniref:GRAM domain-containing protein n=1 Tax=Gossypium anomalum TaxID=47600 RepID=A0A8J6CNJ6_9ROSI|nr:hypothetical protein CXB51_026560 [Gossypium anomalum]
MEKSKTETERNSSSMQSPSGGKNMKDSDPVLDEDDFVIVPTSEPETKEMQETQIPKQIQTEQSPSRRKSVHWSPELKMDIVKDILGRWGKKVEEATRKAEDLAENTWQHCILNSNPIESLPRSFKEVKLGVRKLVKVLPVLLNLNVKTNSSFTDAAMGRIAQGTKVLAEGGYERVFRQTFETVPKEQLLNSFACYLSTSAGPVMGVLYVSTAKLAYCIIPFHQLRAINPSSSKKNPAEKYIQVICVDSHEFWFMGFLNYNGAVTCLQEASQLHGTLSM